MHDVANLFARQDSLATLAQLAELGLGRGTVRGRIERGEWEHWGPGLVGLSGVPESWERHVRASVLTAGADAAVSHATAARLHGLEGFAQDTSLHVTVCGGGHRRAFGPTVVHRSQLLTPKQCVVVDGMRVVSRPLALVQVASHVSRDDVQRALDGMLRRGDRPGWIDQVATAWLHPGVGGASLVLDVLRESTSSKLPRIPSTPPMVVCSPGDPRAPDRARVSELGMAWHAVGEARRCGTTAFAASARVGAGRVVVDRPRSDRRRAGGGELPRAHSIDQLARQWLHIATSGQLTGLAGPGVQ